MLEMTNREKKRVCKARKWLDFKPVLLWGKGTITRPQIYSLGNATYSDSAHPKTAYGCNGQEEIRNRPLHPRSNRQWRD